VIWLLPKEHHILRRSTPKLVEARISSMRAHLAYSTQVLRSIGEESWLSSNEIHAAHNVVDDNFTSHWSLTTSG
jgi:hypothetical protein